MTTRMLIEKEKQASRLRARSSAFVECDAPRLEKELAPFLEEGETMPDVALLMTLVLRRVSNLVEELAEAVQADLIAGQEITLARWDRSEACDEVSSVLKSHRDLFSGLAVDPRLTEPVPTQPHDLLRRAGSALHVLQKTEPGLPDLRGVTIDPESLASSLQPGADELRVALEKVESGEGEVSLAREVKWRAKAEFETGYGRAYRLLEALAGMVGKRIRLLETGFGR